MEAGSPRSGCQHVGFWGGPVPGLQTASCLLVASSGREEGEVQLFFFSSENTDSIMGAPFAWLDCLPKATPPNTIPLRGRASTYECWRGTNMQSLTPLNMSLWLWSTQERPHCFCQPVRATQCLHVCMCVLACMHICAHVYLTGTVFLSAGTLMSNWLSCYKAL